MRYAFLGMTEDTALIAEESHIKDILDRFPDYIGLRKSKDAVTSSYGYVEPTPSHWGVNGFVLIVGGHVSVLTAVSQKRVEIDVVYHLGDFDKNETLKYFIRELNLLRVHEYNELEQHKEIIYDV